MAFAFLFYREDEQNSALSRFPDSVKTLIRLHPFLESALDCYGEEESLEAALEACDDLLTGVRDEWEGVSLNYTSFYGDSANIYVEWIIYNEAEGHIPTAVFRAAIAEWLQHLKGPTVYADGQIRRKEQYRNGKRHGSWKIFYPTGVVWFKGSYINGVRDGLWRYFHPNGQLQAEERFVSGKWHGEVKTWFENSRLESRNVYVNGISADGRSSEGWDKQGLSVFWAEYQDGAQIRVWHKPKEDSVLRDTP